MCVCFGIGGGEGRSDVGGMGTYGAGWAFEDADLAGAFFEDVVDCAHEVKLHVVGLIGVVEVGWGGGGHFWGVGCWFGVGIGHCGLGVYASDDQLSAVLLRKFVDESRLENWRKLFGVCECKSSTDQACLDAMKRRALDKHPL